MSFIPAPLRPMRVVSGVCQGKVNVMKIAVCFTSQIPEVTSCNKNRLCTVNFSSLLYCRLRHMFAVQSSACIELSFRTDICLDETSLHLSQRDFSSSSLRLSFTLLWCHVITRSSLCDSRPQTVQFDALLSCISWGSRLHYCNYVFAHSHRLTLQRYLCHSRILGDCGLLL